MQREEGALWEALLGVTQNKEVLAKSILVQEAVLELTHKCYNFNIKNVA